LIYVTAIQKAIAILNKQTIINLRENTMILKQIGVGTFSNYEKTEIALRELKDSNFLMDRVSVVGRDINNHTDVTGANTSNRLVDFGNLDTNEHKVGETAIDGAMAGITLGGFTGLLVGLGALAIPGVGPVMLAGAAATALATTISGGVIGGVTGTLAGGLVGLGIPADRAKVYSDRIAKGDYLVMVEGTETNIPQAESILRKHGIHEWHIYESPSEPERILTTSSSSHLRV
jgi:hypothetical protein